MDVKPGSMGQPLPGVEACIVERLAGGVSVIDRPDVEGELALRRGWPSMFRGYLNEDERYRKCFAGEFYLSGDLAKRDADGYYWFVGRADDVIKSAGHLIGPFEVESVLMEHPAVAEAGVIGKPDSLLGESVKAFVALRPGFAESDALQARTAGPCPQAPRPGRGAPGDRVCSDAAAHAQRQDHAPPAQGARVGPARRRHVDPGIRSLTMAGRQPKTLVVFFSRDGHTRRIAHILAERLQADLEELHAVQSRAGAIGYAQSALEAVAKLAPAIETPQHDGSAHELVVIGSPVWFWSLSSPLRTWLLQADLQRARVAFFCTMGGSGGWRAFDAMATLAGKKPVATLELTAHEVDAEQSSQLDEFVLRLQGSQPSTSRKPAARAARRRPAAGAKPLKGRR